MPSTSKREIIRITALVLLSVMLFIVAIYLAANGPKYRVYDCSLSEISPDFPPEVREECRRIRAKYI